MIEKVFDWLHFVALASRDALDWTTAYRKSEARALELASHKALALLRCRRLTCAARELVHIEHKVFEVERRSISRFGVMGRWYFGVLAYLRYCHGNYAEAKNILHKSEACVRRAVTKKRFLIPFAQTMTDLRLQHARVARNRGRRQEMERHIEIARGMNQGRRPLLVTGRERDIFLQDVIEFYRCLDLKNEERSWMSDLLEEEVRFKQFEDVVQVILRKQRNRQ